MSVSHRIKKNGTKSYHYRFRNADGRFIQKFGFRTKDEAKKAERQAMSAIEEDRFVDESKVTVADYLSKWLPGEKSQVKPSTFDSYRMIVTTYLVPGIGHVRLQKLTKGDLQTFYGQLEENGGKGGKGLSVRTVRYCHVLVKKALEAAVEDRLIARNPADKAKPPKERSKAKPETKAWPVHELKKFLASVEQDRLYPLWYVTSSTGMRRAEVAGLPWSDVDLDAATITVRATRVALADYKVIDSTPKSKDGERVIDLDAATVQILRKWQLQRKEERLSWGAAWTDCGLVFTKEDGSPLHPGFISDAFDKRVKRAGVPRIVFHGLRHTHATAWLREGLPIKVLSERLGHSDIKVTLQLYGHVMAGWQKESAAKFGELMAGS